MNIFGVISMHFRVVSKGQSTEFGFLKFQCFFFFFFFFFFRGGGVLIIFEGKQ